jgi:hypothetical protein
LGKAEVLAGLLFVAWLNVAVQQSVVQAALELLVPGGEWLSL